MVTVTEAAADHILAHLRAGDGSGLGIRIIVNTTGCSGLAYGVEVATTYSSSTDKMFESEFGVNIFVDLKSYEYVKGMEIDYVVEGLNSGLKFNNPNAVSECGCGETFSV